MNESTVVKTSQIKHKTQHITALLGLCTAVLVFDYVHGMNAYAAANGTPGQLLTIRESTRNTLPAAGKNYLITYLVPSPTGENRVVYGQVSLPASAPPQGGYPVLSWGEGTTGNAPQCAPSLVSSYAINYLNEWLKRGYAVLRTDYVGWGADAPRLELNAASNADSMAYIVVAAHQLSTDLSRDWIAIGHSLGGGAALWTASRNYPYPLKGAIALAPVGPGVLTLLEDVHKAKPIAQFTQQFLAAILLGAQASDPSINLEKLVANEMKPQLEAMRRSACLGDPSLAKFAHLPPGGYLQSDEEYVKVVQFLRAQDPSSLQLKVPVLVAQGKQDETSVTEVTTRAMVASLCSKKAQVDYLSYDKANHEGVISASSDNAFRFAEAVLSDKSVNNSCQG